MDRLRFIGFCYVLILLTAILIGLADVATKIENMQYIVVTATPTYELFQEPCVAYCPTVYPEA